MQCRLDAKCERRSKLLLIIGDWQSSAARLQPPGHVGRRVGRTAVRRRLVPRLSMVTARPWRRPSLASPTGRKQRSGKKHLVRLLNVDREFKSMLCFHCSRLTRTTLAAIPISSGVGVRSQRPAGTRRRIKRKAHKMKI